MTLDNTIHNLKRELIRAFAVLDGWFDKDPDLLKHRPSDHSSVSDVLKQIMLTNAYMLAQINDGCSEAMKQVKLNNLNLTMKEYTLGKLEFEDPEVYHFFMNMYQKHKHPKNDKALQEVRTELRDQLDQCLCHLELMKNGEGAMHSSKLSASHARKIDMYQWIHLLAVHIEKQIEKLQKIQAQYDQQFAAR